MASRAQGGDLVPVVPHDARSRAVDAAVGALIADAACMPLHWIYARDTYEAALALHPSASVVFFPTPSCPYYNSTQFPGHYELGRNSPYGEQMRAYLEYLSVEKWDVDRFPAWFAEWAHTYDGRKDHATKEFESNHAANRIPAGADDAQANSFGKISIALLCEHSNNKERFLTIAEEMVRAHQHNDEAVKYALSMARGLWTRVVENASLTDALAVMENDPTVATQFKQAKAFVGVSAEDMCAALGPLLTEDVQFQLLAPKSCAFPQAFIVAVKLLLDAAVVGRPLDAIEANIAFGGDSCSRATFIGAFLGSDIYGDSAVALDARARALAACTRVTACSCALLA